MSDDAAANPADTPFRPVTLEDLAQPNARDAAAALAGLLEMLAPIDDQTVSTSEVMAGMADLVRAHLACLGTGILEVVFRLKDRDDDTFWLEKRSPLYPLFALATNGRPLEILGDRLPRAVPLRRRRLVITVTDAAVILGGTFLIWRSKCPAQYVAVRPRLPRPTDAEVRAAAERLLDPGLSPEEVDCQLDEEAERFYLFLEFMWRATADEGADARRLMERQSWREFNADYALALGLEDLFRDLFDPDGVLLEAARERLRY